VVALRLDAGGTYTHKLTWTDQPGVPRPTSLCVGRRCERWTTSQAHADPKTMPCQAVSGGRAEASSPASSAFRYNDNPGTTENTSNPPFWVENSWFETCVDSDGKWVATWQDPLNRQYAFATLNTVLPFCNSRGNAYETMSSWRVP